jgi:hypothetical protein
MPVFTETVYECTMTYYRRTRSSESLRSAYLINLHFLPPSSTIRCPRCAVLPRPPRPPPVGTFSKFPQLSLKVKVIQYLLHHMRIPVLPLRNEMVLIEFPVPRKDREWDFPKIIIREWINFQELQIYSNKQMDEIRDASCPLASSGVSGVELSGSATRVSWLARWILRKQAYTNLTSILTYTYTCITYCGTYTLC